MSTRVHVRSLSAALADVPATPGMARRLDEEWIANGRPSTGWIALDREAAVFCASSWDLALVLANTRGVVVVDLGSSGVKG